MIDSVEYQKWLNGVLVNVYSDAANKELNRKNWIPVILVAAVYYLPCVLVWLNA